ncbi:MAG: FixH family protein [Flavobacteriaceae bacterium]|nr:FixH family protein [Flavobacteriaceae bacterium]MDZ4148615.1 FixH family protein [Flavobacteriaceae bacterium]
MKINWGTAIVIVFVCFATFILTFVFLATTQKKYDHELVTQNYYEQEIHLQNDIDSQNLSNKLNYNLEISTSNKGILIHFPGQTSFHKITGIVSLYRPSDQHLDFEIPISLSSSQMLIPDEVLAGGRWDIKVRWQYENQKLLFKKQITY